jgi:hypothetical protein
MKKIPALEIIATISLVSIAITVMLLVWPELKNEVSAAWAQGILTTLGLFVAMWVANWQAQQARKHAQELRNEDLKQKREGVMAIAEAAFDEVEAIEHASNSQDLDSFFEDQYHMDQFAHAITSLKAIPLHELHSYNMVVGILDLIDALLRTQEFCENVTREDRGFIIIADNYIAFQEDNFTKAMQALTFIRGGILGWTTEEINRRNGLQGRNS